MHIFNLAISSATNCSPEFHMCCSEFSGHLAEPALKHMLPLLAVHEQLARGSVGEKHLWLPCRQILKERWHRCGVQGILLWWITSPEEVIDGLDRFGMRDSFNFISFFKFFPFPFSYHKQEIREDKLWQVSPGLERSICELPQMSK